MLFTLAVLLVGLWLLGLLAHVGGALIHLLPLFAVVVLLLRVISGRRPAA